MRLDIGVRFPFASGGGGIVMVFTMVGPEACGLEAMAITP